MKPRSFARPLIGLLVLLFAASVFISVSRCDEEQPATQPAAVESKDKPEKPPVAEDEFSQAKVRVRKHVEERLEAALKAMDYLRETGVPASSAENMAIVGLERNLDPQDFEPLGKYVAERHAVGLKGKDLAEAIHREVRHRQEIRKRVREERGKDMRSSETGREKTPSDESPAGVSDVPRGHGAGKGKGGGKAD